MHIKDPGTLTFDLYMLFISFLINVFKIQKKRRLLAF